MKNTVKAATLLNAAMVALALAFTCQAHAATDLGDIGRYKTFDEPTSTGSFEDLFTFTVDTKGKAVFALTGVQLAPSLGVTFSSARLYDGSYSYVSQLNATKLIANGVLDSATSTSSSVVINSAQGHTTSSLAPGTTYTLYVAGTSGGSSSYVGIVALAPVPEPETYAMLLAGLGMIGSVARRRRNRR